jgi:glycosyltransferase involved in cell wall biosynthesis
MKSIAVIIPFYNIGASIFDAITSLQLQTFKDWTVILVDDGSK